MMTTMNRRESYVFQFIILIIFCTPANSSLMPSFMEFGSCSDVPEQQSFDVNKYTGTWYPILLVPNEFVAAQHCLAYDYKLNGSQNNQVAFYETGLDEGRAAVARQVFLDIGEDVSFIAPGTVFRPTIHTTIMATDYKTYACMYSCLQRFTFKGEFAWVLSREPRLQRSYVEKCKAVIEEHSSFDWDKVIFLEQGETCPYWPNITAKRLKALNRENAEASERLDKELNEAVDTAVGEDMEDTLAMQELFFMENKRAVASTLDSSLVLAMVLSVLLWRLSN